MSSIIWRTDHSHFLSIFSFFSSNHKLCERHPVKIFSPITYPHSYVSLIHLSIICSSIHSPFPPQRNPSSLFHPSFSWKLDSHLFWQWHIAAVCHHIPSTQRNVLANSPCVCLPLHLHLSLFIHPSQPASTTSSRWPPPSLPPPILAIARLHHFISLSLSLSLGRKPVRELQHIGLYCLFIGGVTACFSL